MSIRCVLTLTLPRVGDGISVIRVVAELVFSLVTDLLGLVLTDVVRTVDQPGQECGPIYFIGSYRKPSMADGEQESESEAESADDETEREGERVMNRADGAEILREVAAGVENGTIDIEGENGFSVAVPERFELEVEYETTDDEAEFEVELEWQLEDGEAVPADE